MLPSINQEAARNKRNTRVQTANKGSDPSLTPTQRLGREAENMITFERIYVNGINPHDKFIELQHTMGILEQMEAGVFGLVET